MIIDAGTQIYIEKSMLPGVKRVLDLVRRDIELIVGYKPAVVEINNADDKADKTDKAYITEKTDISGEIEAEKFETRNRSGVIIVGTIGHSEILEKLEETGRLDLSSLRGKREVYSITVTDDIVSNGADGIGLKSRDKAESENTGTVIIAGSDKRGTIYGLFKLSEMMGVSPLVNWNHVWPQKKESVDIDCSRSMVSKEPSVKYRGFFINDEWPAFGTWAKEHFGGINAECYERVFELLLRLKGNYLWPAMWNSNFELDGPGLKSAELADELGVVMSMSHHEPCMRSGEEYSMVRGRDSIYGDAWDFNSNEEGIKRFWRDGLKRSSGFEQVITMGMRGENDTAIMRNASLADNIDLIRRVVRTQNNLIRETIDEDLTKVPRQIVLFTEVEEFFYGNEETSGLMNDEELDGVTLMLSDNNAGYLRTLPNEKMKQHKGGYGMYYHMDMHGGPHSFQWIGSTYLPRVQDQMTTAYQYGVREIWVTNIGDIGTQELGLSYFLDLAYDIDRYGVHPFVGFCGQEDMVDTDSYIRTWVEQQFGHAFCESDISSISGIISDYLELLAKRKHEALNANVFDPVNFGEADEVLRISRHIQSECNRLKSICPEEMKAAFISLIYYPASGTANLFEMWIMAGKNRHYASENRLEANVIADSIESYLKRDEELIDEYQSVDDGYFYGFGISEHIGFTFWNDEDCKLPQKIYIIPAKVPRMIVVRENEKDYLTGDFWRDMKPAVWNDAMRPDIDHFFFEIANAGQGKVDYRIESSCEWLSFSSTEGEIELKERISIDIDRGAFLGKAQGEFKVKNISAGTEAKIIINAYNPLPDDIKNAFWERDGIIAINAVNFSNKAGVPLQKSEELKEAEKKEVCIAKLIPYGRGFGGIRVYPVTADFEDSDAAPYAEYRIVSEEGGRYNLEFHLSPSTPVVFERKHFIGYSVNEGKMIRVNTVKNEKIPFFLSPQWEEEAITSVKKVVVKAELRKGLNILRFYFVSPQIILERIVFSREDSELPESFLGPKESYYHR